MKFDEYLEDYMILGDDEDDSSSDDDSSDDSSDEGDGDDVTEKGMGSQFADSVKGMLIGLVCFIAAWPVMFKAATCQRAGDVVGKAVPIAQAVEGKEAFVTGIPVADEIGDGDLFKIGKYLRIDKSIEYYAIKSTDKSETKKKGTKKVTTSWTEYSFEWTTSPQPIKDKGKDRWKKFAKANNLKPTVDNPVAASGEKSSDSIYTKNCKVSDYAITMDSTVKFKGGSKEQIVNINPKDGKLLQKKDPDKLGDKRIKYTSFPSDIQYTFTGKLGAGKTLAPFMLNNNPEVWANPGTFEGAKSAAASQDSMNFWLGLIAGFILMGVGLTMLAGPVTQLLDFIPFVGELGAGLIKVVLWVIAGVLSVVFYVVLYYLYNYWYIAIILLAAVVGFLIYRKKSAAPKAA
jgi:hypothetical protein